MLQLSVQAGVTAPPDCHPLRPSFAVCARDWQFLFDVGTATGFFLLRSRLYPTETADVVIFSQSLRVVILIELTVPLEDRKASANTRKLNIFIDPIVSARKKAEKRDRHAFFLSLSLHVYLSSPPFFLRSLLGQ